MAVSQSLIDAVSHRTLVPFVGAGLSMTVKENHFPSWPGLIERLAERCEKEGLPQDAAEIRAKLASSETIEAAEVALTKLKKPRFADELKTIFGKRVPMPDLSSVSALWRLRPQIVITTNYD